MSMNLTESKERFSESLKRAASRCRELAKIQKYPTWNSIADSLDALRVKGMSMANAKGRSKMQVNSDIETHKEKLAARVN